MVDAYEKLKYLGPVVKEVSLPSTKELDVDGMNQITKVMGKWTALLTMGEVSHICRFSIQNHHGQVS